MRITPVSSKAAMNIHFICNPNIVSQLDVKLFSQLTFKHSNGQTFHAVKDDFIKLGQLFDATLVDDAAYRKGIEQFVVDLSNLKQILDVDKDLRENVIVVVSNSSNDGASGIGNSSRQNANSDLTVVRDDLCYFADMFFCATESSIKYFLGEGPLTKEQIVRKYGRLKPCIHGCDAHKNIDILTSNSNRYCWIKADCTFEGLKQIIYEPKERVKICDAHPEKKRNYNVIDKITINDERFSPVPIVFNPNLTCFIGGKSTGKSIILNNMARLIDFEQYKLKYSGKDFAIQNMKVYWKDGTISDGTNKKNIVYIPQTYLNSLSDNQEEKTEIDEIIQDIILQDKEIKKAYEDFQYDLNETKTALDKEIYDTVKAYESFLLYSRQLTENGSADSIKKELAKLQKERDRITKLLQISDEDIAKYDQCKTRLATFIKQVKRQGIVKALKELREESKHDYDFAETDFVFGGKLPLSDQTVRRRMDQYADKAGVKRIRVHDLRHSHASLVISKGLKIEDLILLSKRLGHRDVKETLNTYSHLFPNAQKKILESIDEGAEM